MPDPAPPLARVGRTLLARSADPAAADGRLLGRFAEAGDADAFAGLVARHGPMVYAVCRRAAGDPHLADDAFQATFLILARRARDVRPREAVRAWLYGVAVRTARTARARADRRLRREAPVPAVPDRPAPAPQGADPDVLQVLDEEIARLPDRLRAVVVLCELDGLSRKAAAARLGVPEGTVSSRLAAARKALAARLRTRGVTAPAAGLGVYFAELARAAAVPRRLTEAAARLAAADAVPAGVAELTRGVFGMTLLCKLTAAVAVLVCGLIAAGSADPARPAPASRRAPVPRPQPPREGVIAVTSFSKDKPVELFKPDGTPLPVPAFGEARSLWMPRLSPDGKRLAAFQLDLEADAKGPWTRNQLFVLDLDAKGGPKEPLLSDARHPSAVWSRDGTKLYGSQIDPDKAADPPENGKPPALVSWVYDPAAKTKTPLAVPAGHAIVDVSPDGKTLLTVTFKGKEPFATAETYLVPLAALKPRPLSDKVFKGLQFSPDGKSVLGTRPRGKATDPDPTLVVVSVADGTEREVKVPAAVTGVWHACWSPDGKRVAYDWLEKVRLLPAPGAPRVVGDAKEFAWRVTVADADGSDPKTILAAGGGQSVSGLDWR
jgi:RNA polymerase sigma factor (sigma-70 family)